MTKFLIYIASIILLLSIPLKAQEEVIEEAAYEEEISQNWVSADQLPIDSAQISPFSLGENLKDKYSGNEFYYREDIEQGQNVLSRMVDAFFRFIFETFGIDISPEVREILEYMIYFLLGIFVIWLIYKLVANQSPTSLFKEKTETLSAEVDLETEHIEEIDFKKWIKSALDQQDYRLAMRYLYLDTLKSMSKMGLLQWHNEKTNIEYLFELNDGPVKNTFKQLCYVYENVWYGEYPIAQHDFETMNQQCQTLQNKVNGR